MPNIRYNTIFRRHQTFSPYPPRTTALGRSRSRRQVEQARLRWFRKLHESNGSDAETSDEESDGCGEDDDEGDDDENFDDTSMHDDGSEAISTPTFDSPIDPRSNYNDYNDCSEPTTPATPTRDESLQFEIGRQRRVTHDNNTQIPTSTPTHMPLSPMRLRLVCNPARVDRAFGPPHPIRPRKDFPRPATNSCIHQTSTPNLSAGASWTSRTGLRRQESSRQSHGRKGARFVRFVRRERGTGTTASAAFDSAPAGLLMDASDAAMR